MVMPQPQPGGSELALPPELSGQRPYPLPAWARRGPGLEIAFLAMGAGLFLLLAWMRLPPWVHLGPLAFVALGAGQLWYCARLHELLRFGTPHAARLERLRIGGEAGFDVEYSMGPGAQRRGHILSGAEAIPDPSRWPQPGDTVVLLTWGKRFPSRVVWGIVPRPGRAPGRIPWIYRAVSWRAVTLAVAATIFFFAAMTWLTWGR